MKGNPDVNDDETQTVPELIEDDTFDSNFRPNRIGFSQQYAKEVKQANGETFSKLPICAVLTRTQDL